MSPADRAIDVLGRLPTTNLRIVTSVGLSVVFVLGTMAAGLLGRELDSSNVYTIAGFLLIMMGLDVAQFHSKRRTHDRYGPQTDPEARDG